MSNGNGELQTWVKNWSALGATGVLALIAMYLVYTNVEGARVTAADVQRTQSAIDIHVDEMDTAMDSLRAILRQICVNTAETTSDRTSCFTRVE